MDDLLKSFKVLNKSGANQEAADLVWQELLRRGINVVGETAQEVAQEGATITGAQLGQKLESGNWQYTADEVKNRLLDTAGSSALSFGVLNVPGAVNNTMYYTKNRGWNQTTRQSTGNENRQEMPPKTEQVQQAEKEAQAGTERQGYTTPAEIQNEAQNGDRALLETARSMTREQQDTDSLTGQTAEQDESRISRDIQDNMERVRRAAGALGESGGKALTAAYTEDTAKMIAPKEAVEGFYKVYNAALKGEQLADTDARSAAALPAHLRYAAQSAGQQDALRAKQAQFFGEKAGLVKDDSWKKAHLSSKTNRTLDALGKALGVQIKFADTVADGQANAQYGNGVITMALDAKDPVLTTVTHEAVHRLREMSPEDYSALADFVRGNLSEETTDFSLQFRERLYQSDDVNTMTEEMVADAFGRVLNDGKAIERLVQDNRSLAEKVRDVLADIVNAVKRVLNHQNLELTAEQKAEFRELEGRMGEMERLFSDALGKAEAQRAKTLQGQNSDATMGTTRHSLKEDGEDGPEGTQGTGHFAQEGAQNRQGGHAVQGTATEILRGDAVYRGQRRGVNASFGQKPVRSWAEGHTVEPARGSVAYMEQQTANKNAAQTDGGTKFSIKRTSQMTLAQQLKMFYDGKMASSDAFYFGETPAVLEKSGFDALPLAMTIGDFRKSTQKKHNIPRRVLKNLMGNLASPLFSFGSGDRAGIVLNDIDGDGYTLLAALERGTDMDRKPVNVINSLYGLEHPAEWIKNQIDSGNEFVLYDEKRANAFLQTYGYMASVGDGIRSTGESVTQNGAEVKTKFSLKTPVEETDKLLALHNKDENSILAAIKLGGLPMPSIAVVKATDGHSQYGPISLVFSKDTIDPQADRRNKVYGSDAWTPTHSDARVDYKVDYDVKREFEQNIETLANDVAGGIFSQSSVLDMAGVGDQTSMSVEEIAHRLATRYDSVRAAYLSNKGQDIDIVYRTKEFDSFGNDALKSYLEKVGEQEAARLAAKMLTGERLSAAEVETVKDAIMESWTAKNEWRLNKKPELRETRIAKQREKLSDLRAEDFARNAWDFYEDGGTTTDEVNRMETAENLRHAVDDKAVEAFALDMLRGLTGEPGIYNGSELFDARGNRKSFKETHWSYTLENIVRAMNNAKTRGQGMWGMSGSGLVATATPAYNSVQEMHADESRLRTVDSSEYEQMVKDLDGELDRVAADIMHTTEHHASNTFEEEEIIGDVIAMAAQGKRTTAGVKQTFRKEGYTISDKQARAVLNVIERASSLPTGYFEAKPQRAVGFDEVLAAVIPDDSSQKLRDGLEQAGVRMLEYKTGDDADRLAKVNSVDNAKFSRKEKNRAQDIAAMQEENRLLREQLGDYLRLQKQNETLRESREYWKGQTRRTERVTTDKKAVGKAARELVQSYGAEVSTQQVQDKLQSLYDYIASGYDGKDELTFTEAWRRAKDIARDLVENAAAQDDELYRQYGDLRQYMKGTALVVTDQVKGDITDYGDFHKRNMGRMRLVNGTETNIDQVYKELSERWPEFFDENMQVTPTDQLLQISQVLNEVGTVETYNPFSADMQEAVAGAANEIMETFFDLPQTKKTFADRQALKLEEAKGKGRQQVQKVREDYNRRLDQLREQNRERVQRVIAKERENRAKKIDELKEHYKAKDAAGRERQTARELRAKITRHAGDLSQKLLRPSDKQHIPEEMRGAVAAMLESINQESQYTLDENGKRVKNGGGTPTKRTEAFRALKEQYAKIVAEGGDLVIDPSLLGSDAEGIKGGFDAVIAMQDIKLADMSVSQLQTVWQVVKAVEHSVNTAGKVLSKSKYKRTADWAQALSVETSSRRSKNSLTRSHASIDLETPYTFFSHYGQAGKDVYRMLRNAQDREQLMVNHVAEEVQKVVDPKTVKKLEETTRTYTTEQGEELTLSTAQVMELHELMKRKQAHDHLLKGGIVQPEIKSAKIRRGTDSIRLTDTDLANIIGTLTAEEVKIADGLQALTTGVLADYGNQASMEAYGYKKFTERDYWPIKSAREGLHSDVEKGGSNTRSIKNIGMAKTTMPHASNALDIGGIFTTFANHASDMTDYAAWLCTMEDVNRLYNFKFRDEEGIPTGKTIKGVLDRVGGQGSQKYWHNLMEDIQNGINAPGDSPMWDIAGRTIGAFKGSRVGANIRVVIQQPTAFFRAAAVLDPGDMAKGLTRGVTKGDGWKKALEYSPIAMRKDAGGFDIASPRQMTETLFDNRTGVRKMNDALSAPAGKADAVTWGKLWNACEWATSRDYQGLEKGSQAFYEQTAKLFAEVIDQTQVVDGVLQRSNIMRSSNAVVKQATSFMGEPIMSLNLLMRSWDQWKYEQDTGKRSKAMKTMRRAATALVVTNVVNALAQSLIDAMRDDDEDKKYWERFRTAFTGVTGDEESAWQTAWNIVMKGNFGSNLNPLTQIPFAKDALSIMQGYDVSRADMETVSDLLQAGQIMIQSADGTGKKTRAYAAKELLGAAAGFFGTPVSNLARDIWGLMRSVAVETGNIPLQYEMEKAIYNITNSSNGGRYLDIMYRALEQGDMDSYQHIREELSDQMGKSFTEMDSAMKSRYEKAKDKDGAYTLPKGSLDLIGIRERNETEKDKGFTADDLTAAQYQRYTQRKADTYRKAMDKGENAKGYNTLDEEKRNTFEGKVNTYAKETALAAESGGKYKITNEQVKKVQEAERKYGISPGEYLLIQTRASGIESLKDKDGETISNSKGLQIMELVYGYTGLSDKQKEAMFEYLGVGKTIRHYNPGKVKQELEKMKKK